MNMNRYRLADLLGISPETKAILDEGSNHPYNCTCPTCLQWWKNCGPDENGNYGPFTREQVEGV